MRMPDQSTRASSVTSVQIARVSSAAESRVVNSQRHIVTIGGKAIRSYYG